MNFWLKISDELAEKIIADAAKERVSGGFERWIKECASRIHGSPGEMLFDMDDCFWGETSRHSKYCEGDGGWQRMALAILSSPIIPPEDEEGWEDV